MGTTRVKAVPVNSVVHFAESELTPDQFRSAIAQIPAEEAHYFTGHLLAHELVPVSALNRFTKLAAAAKEEPVESFARRAGYYGAREGLRTVYKFLMLVMSVEAVLRKAPFMWSRVYDSGEMTVDAQKESAQLRVRGFEGDQAGCARIAGWFEVIGTEAGAKDVRVVHSTCSRDGGPDCVWDIRWR
jgi:hypothetical protein